MVYKAEHIIKNMSAENNSRYGCSIVVSKRGRKRENIQLGVWL